MSHVITFCSELVIIDLIYMDPEVSSKVTESRVSCLAERKISLGFISHLRRRVIRQSKNLALFLNQLNFLKTKSMILSTANAVIILKIQPKLISQEKHEVSYEA